jgi:S1-C subfamily serine protease
MGIQLGLVEFERDTRTPLVVALAITFVVMNTSWAADISVGSGIVIGEHGEVLTNAHVVRNCTQITVRSSSAETAAAFLVARDERNDLAVIRGQVPVRPVATFREGLIRPGDTVVVLGYPLSGLLAATRQSDCWKCQCSCRDRRRFTISSDQCAGAARQ